VQERYESNLQLIAALISYLNSTILCALSRHVISSQVIESDTDIESGGDRNSRGFNPGHLIKIAKFIRDLVGIYYLVDITIPTLHSKSIAVGTSPVKSNPS